jgi:hypothetical protein
MKEGEGGGACKVHGREEKCLQSFGWINLKGRDQKVGLCVDDIRIGKK